MLQANNVHPCWFVVHLPKRLEVILAQKKKKEVWFFGLVCVGLRVVINSRTETGSNVKQKKMDWSLVAVAKNLIASVHTEIDTLRVLCDDDA